MDNLPHYPTPTVPVTLELDEPLLQLCATGDQKNPPVCEILAQETSELLHTLGIPGHAHAALAPIQSGQMRNQRWMRLVVNGKLLHYPDELLRSAYSYQNGAFPNPGITPATILAWLKNKEGNAVESAPADIAGFFTLACLEIMQRQPAALLSREQLEVYLAELADVAELPANGLTRDRDALLEVFQSALNLKVSIADVQAVAETLRQAKTHLDFFEGLVDTLSAGVVEIHLPPDDLREFTLNDPQSKTGLFPSMRDGLFHELGMQYPDFVLKPDEGLKPGSFRFKINSQTTLPMFGLKPGEILVNDTSERLQLMNINARPAINPATSQPASLIDLDQKTTVEAAGLTTWDPWGFLILVFEEALRKNGACLINRRSAQASLDSIKYSFPAVIETVQSVVTHDQITQTLRGLIAEGIPINDLLAILERLVDWIYARDEACKYLILDDRPVTWDLGARQASEISSLVAFVRAGMKPQISFKYARGTDTLVAYLLDIQIEKLFAGKYDESNGRKGTPPEEEGQESILAAIANELSYLPATAQTPVILTSAQIRSAFRQVIADEFPRISVIAYQELMPRLNIQPVARIAL